MIKLVLSSPEAVKIIKKKVRRWLRLIRTMGFPIESEMTTRNKK